MNAEGGAQEGNTGRDGDRDGDDARRGGGDAGGSGEEGLGAEGAGGAARRATATVAFDKFTQVRNMLVKRIRQSEDGEEVAGQGMRQVDLTNWYIGEVASTLGITDTKELLSELKLVRTIIGHLIKKAQTLMVVQEAEPLAELPDVAAAVAEDDDDGEEAVAAAAAAAAAAVKERKRAIENRYLAVSPNFNFES